MPRKRQRVRTFLDRVKDLIWGVPERMPPQSRRQLRLEGLEHRQLMTADLGVISGHVFRDSNGNGSWNTGEAGIAQVSVQLWRDNGDGVFNSASDTLVTSATTGADGAYTFDNLAEADYFLRRPEQTLTVGSQSNVVLPEKISSDIHIAALKTFIDSFDTPTNQTAAVDTTNDNTPGTSIAAGLDTSKTIGGEREIITNFTGDAEGPGILTSARVATINAGGAKGLLLLDATSSAKGTYTLVWDGSDGTASTTPNLSPGLGGANLQVGGATHLRLKLNSLDLPGAVVKVTVYTDATHFSTGTVTLQPRVSNGVADSSGITEYHFNFDGTGTGGFALGSGAAGNADFSSVRAVVLSIDVPPDVDAQIDTLGAYGPATATADLGVDQVDVSVDKSVDNKTPTIGQVVNYTLTVSNAATVPGGAAAITATGVALTDTLFTSLVSSGKLSYVSDNSGGAFNTSTGVWNVGSLAAGQTKSIVIALKVNQSALPSANNTLSLTSLHELDVDTDDWTDNETITPNYVDIGVTKTVNNAHPNHNDSVQFTITAKNFGTADASAVKLSDVFSTLAGYSVTTVTPSAGTFDSATGVWTVGNLAAGQSATLIVSGKLVDGKCDPFTNTAAVASIGGGVVDVNPANDSASATVTPQEADLGVLKTVLLNPTPSKSNPQVTFQISVTNTGPDAATGVIIADQLPAGLTFVSASSPDYNAATGQWNVGTVGVGQTRSITIVGTLASGVITGTISNTATVAALDQCDDNHANDSSTASVNPQSVDLSVSKTVSTTTPNYRQNVVFTVTVTNAGPNAATNVTLQDSLPAGLTFVSSTATQGSYDAATGVWAVGNVNVGQTLTLMVTATVNTTSAQTNTAEVSAADQTDVDSTPNNHVPGEDDIASVTVQPQAIDLSVTKSVNNTVPAVGGTVVFTVTVTNSGPNTATGVSLYDALPAGLTYVSSTATAGAYNPATHIWNVGGVGVGQTFTMTMTAVVNTSSLVINTVEVITADQTDLDSTPNNGRAGEDDIASAVLQPQVPTPQGDPDPPLSKRRFLAR